MTPPNYNTADAAIPLGVKPETLRRAYSTHGHYCGIKPIKLANRTLRWPADQIKRYLSGEAAQ